MADSGADQTPAGSHSLSTTFSGSGAATTRLGLAISPSGGGGGGGTGTTTTASTTIIDNPAQNYFNGFAIFLGTFWFVVWFFMTRFRQS